MVYCPNCGAVVDGRFCAKCGTAVSQPSPGESIPPPPPPPGSGQSQTGSGLTDNVASMLTYLLGILTGVIFLVLEPYNKNPTIRFHAFQSVFLFGGLIALHIALTILYAVMPFVIVTLLWAIQMLVSLTALVLWIMLMVKAYNGQKWVLPIVGPLAEQQAYPQGR